MGDVVEMKLGRLREKMRDIMAVYNNLPEEERQEDAENMAYVLVGQAKTQYFDIREQVVSGFLPGIHGYLNAHENLSHIYAELIFSLRMKEVFVGALGLDEKTFKGAVEKALKNSQAFYKGRKKKRRHYKSEVLTEIVQEYLEAYRERAPLSHVVQELRSSYCGIGKLIASPEDVCDLERTIVYYPNGVQESESAKFKTVSYKATNNLITKIYKRIIL